MPAPTHNTINLKLDHACTCLPQVSTARAKALARLGIKTVRDLVYHYPHRYLDLSHVAMIAQARSGRPWTIAGTIHAIEEKEPKPGVELIEITIVDDSGTLIVTFFRQKHLLKIFKAGDSVVVAGQLVFNFGFKRMTNPFIDHLAADKSAYDMARVLPIHRTTAGISTAWMRNIVRNALDYVRGASDFLPSDIVERYRLLHFWDALRMVHFPTSMEEVGAAKRTLKYSEILLLQLETIGSAIEARGGARGIEHCFDGPNLLSLQQSLDFKLTGDQQKAFADIVNFMSSAEVCNHLLLGDVGTGKTLLAAMSIAACVDGGYQALMMAPTEILTAQHQSTLSHVFAKTNIRFEVITGSTPRGKRQLVLQDFAEGKIDMLLGTHALLQNDVAGRRVGLVVIDEQHRFGVEQRRALIEKGQFTQCVEGEDKRFAADVLSLTATPIPRSLCMAIYGDMTYSFLTQVPTLDCKLEAGNDVDTTSAASTQAAQSQQRTTFALHKDDAKAAYDAAFDALERGEQVFVVCPLVGVTSEQRNKRANFEPQDAMPDSRSSSLKMSDDQEDVVYEAVAIENEEDFADDNPAAATTHAEILQSKVFTTYTVEVLHGRMSADEKRRIMQDFQDGKIDVLVTTTVIEVGIDVPNATVMIVEDADRFGLSALHQLRGRVGRGHKPAKIFLLSTAKNQVAINRLKAMETCNDGAELARIDLQQRREGDILGNRQHGTGLLKLVSVMQDTAIIDTAHKDAVRILRDDPALKAPENMMLRYELSRSFAEVGD